MNRNCVVQFPNCTEKELIFNQIHSFEDLRGREMFAKRVHEMQIRREGNKNAPSAFLKILFCSSGYISERIVLNALQATGDQFTQMKRKARAL